MTERMTFSEFKATQPEGIATDDLLEAWDAYLWECEEADKG